MHAPEDKWVGLLEGGNVFESPEGAVDFPIESGPFQFVPSPYTSLKVLYKASSPAELESITHVTVPFGAGSAILRVQNIYLVPGQSVRLDTADESVSVVVTADRVQVLGDETSPTGMRKLMQGESSHCTRTTTSGGGSSGSALGTGGGGAVTSQWGSNTGGG